MGYSRQKSGPATGSTRRARVDSEQRLAGLLGVEQPEPPAPGARLGRCVDDELEEPVFIVHSVHSDPEMIVLQTLRVQYLLCARSGLPLRLPERLPPTATSLPVAVRVLCDAFVARVCAARPGLLWPARHLVWRLYSRTVTLAGLRQLAVFGQSNKARAGTEGSVPGTFTTRTVLRALSCPTCTPTS